MPYKPLSFLMIFTMLAANGWTEEPSRKQNPVKQRVPAKVLREALLIQDSAPRPTQVAPDHSLQRLNQIADKLHKNGDCDDADFLRQFIQEHRKLMSEAAHQTASLNEPVFVSLQAFAVDRDQLPVHSVLNDSKITSKAAEVRAELEGLLTQKKARVLLHPTSLKTKWNQPASTHEENEVPTPASEASGVLTTTTRETGIAISVLPVQMTTQESQLTVKCTLTNLKNALADTLGTGVPGMEKRRVESTLNLTTSEPVFFRVTGDNHSPLVIVEAKLTHGN